MITPESSSELFKGLIENIGPKLKVVHDKLTKFTREHSEDVTWSQAEEFEVISLKVDELFNLVNNVVT